MNLWHRGICFLLFVGLLAGCATSQHFLHTGERIVFLGDSITQLGVKPNGYVTIIQAVFMQNMRG